MTKRQKRFERNRRFVVALFVAAAYRAGDMGLRGMAHAAWGILRSLTARNGTIDRWVYYRRMRCCFKCPIFFLPLRTCSSPLMPGGEEIGCFCEMTKKATDPDAQCWADEFFGDEAEFGWKKNGIA